MMWLSQPILAVLLTPQAINLAFVLICLAGALGANGRLVLLVSALLYLALVLI